MPTTRAEHLKWCKDRAMEYCNNGDLTNALASFASDLGEHEETAGHPAIQLGMMLTISGNLSTQKQMKEFIEGTN